MLSYGKESWFVVGVVTAAVAGYLFWGRDKGPIEQTEQSESSDDTQTMEAHVDPAKEAGICRNWGSIPLVSTDRGLMGGQAVGQNVNYTYPVGQWSGDTVRDGWTAYSYTLMTTEPTFGQNYFGRAVGNQ